MILDSKYDNTKASMQGEKAKKLPAGGYICNIIFAEEQQSRSGKDMIVLYLDIAEGEHKNFYSDLPKTIKTTYGKDQQCYGKMYFQLVYDEKSVSYFKGLIKSIEESNPNYKFDYKNPNNTQTLIGKKVGFIFGEEDFEYNGNIYTDCKPKWARSIKTIKEGKYSIPEYKPKGNNQTTTNAGEVEKQFTKPVTEDIDDDFPLPIPIDNTPRQQKSVAQLKDKSDFGYSDDDDIPF